MKKLATLASLGLMVLLAAVLVLTGCTPTATPTPTASPKPTASPSPSPTASPKPSPSPTATENLTEFYKNNTVNCEVGYGPGGGTDYGARVPAAWWGKITDGGSFVVKNRAGGGGLVSMNEIYRGKTDGLNIGALAWSTVAVAPYLAKDKAIQFDITKFNWLGTYAGNEPAFGVGAKTTYTSMADLQKAKGLKFGSVGAVNDWSMMQALVIDVFGLDAIIIPGFSSTAELQLALSKGEIDGVAAEMSVLRDTVDKGWLKPPLVTIFNKKSLWYPDTPILPDMVTLTAAQQKLFDLMVNYFEAGKTFYAPPGVPANKVEFLRRTFDKLFKDPNFVSMAKLRFYFMNPPLTGEQVQAKAQALAALPPEAGAGLVALLDKYVRK